MRKTATRAVLVLVGALALAQKAPNAIGHWEGRIKIPNRELGITVDLARTTKGARIGSMTVMNSIAVDVPLSGITITGLEVRFTASLPDKASFEGRLAADGTSISGKVTSATGQPAFQLTRFGEANVKAPPPNTP